MRRRHFGLMASFVLGVILPVLASAWYLYAIAADQYGSNVGFAIRSEKMSTAAELLGGLSSLSGSSSSDSDILYQFIQSQDLVEKINAKLDLVKMFSKPEFDPIFAYDTDGTIEDLVAYWPRMVKIDYDSRTDLIELQVHAFTADDARTIAREIVRESSDLINELSAIARDDATRYAREDLKLALDRLKTARGTLTKFRSETRIVDPSADIQGQMGLLNSLESQLAESQIELNLLLDSAREGDPRVAQTRRRIEVIQQLIEKERAKFGLGGAARTSGERDYSTLIGDYERIMVEVEYARQSYLAAQAALDTALAEAQRKSRYLATYTPPTLAQSPQYPQRALILVIIAAFLLLGWAILALIYYSLRDRR